MKPVKTNKAEEPELEPLCCCEYIDRNGEKNHVAACLCDCQDLDEGCDSISPECWKLLSKKMTFNISEKNLVPNGNNEVFIQFVNNYVSKNCCHTESIVWEKNKDIWQVAFPLNNYFRLKKSLQRWITCKSVQPETCERIMDTISDRLRIPWLRGAKKVNISIIPPLILLPVFLRVASWHFLLGGVVLTSLPVLALWYYYLTHRRKEQTLFFLSLGLFSLGYMYYVFLQEVVPKGRVGPTQLALLTCGLFLILLALYRAKKNPGYLRNPASSDRSLSTSQAECLNRKGQKTKGFPGAETSGSLNNRTPKDDPKGSSRALAGSPTKVKEDWCAKCQLVRPARAWHCRICGICVRRMDHHCVWINSCVGESNHQAFILALSIFLLTSVYGITLTLDTICRDRSVFTALFYCPGVYADYSSALSFTCVWYSVIVTAGMAYIFLIQLINISYNVTEREVQQALRQKTGRRLLWGLIVDTGQYNRGFLRNWYQFSTLGAHPFHHPAEDIV